MTAPQRKAPRARPCPICGKPAGGEHDPFCSRRCREIDLGNWLGGRYAVPTAERPGEGEAPAPSPDGDDDGPPDGTRH